MLANIWDLDDTIYKQPDNFYASCYKAAALSAVLHGYPGSADDAENAASQSYKTYGYSIACFFKDYSLSQKHIEETYAQNVAKLISPCSPTLDYIRDFQGPQILVSHSPWPWVDAMLHKLELQDVFPEDYRITAEVIGHQGKTISTAPFEMARNILDCPADRIRVFEDFSDNLFQAKKANMQTIHITNGRSFPPQSFIDHSVERPYMMGLI